MNILITTELYSDFLNCRYKAFLKATAMPGTASEFQALESTLQTEFAERARQHLRGSLPASQVSHAPKSLAQALQREYPLITSAHANVGHLSVRLDALVRSPTKSSTEYIPVLFVHREQLVRCDKALLAFWGLFLQRIGLASARFGKIIHGESLATARVRIENLIPSVEHDLLDLASFFKGNTGPKLRLNSHCSVCEFREHCRTVAVDNDDLSLLRTLKDKELDKLNAKGIFTTTQLSYTFRPRRRRKNAKKPLQSTIIRYRPSPSERIRSTSLRSQKCPKTRDVSISILKAFPTETSTT